MAEIQTWGVAVALVCSWGWAGGGTAEEGTDRTLSIIIGFDPQTNGLRQYRQTYSLCNSFKLLRGQGRLLLHGRRPPLGFLCSDELVGSFSRK